MLNRVTEKIVIWLIKNKAIGEAQIELYSYAVFCLLMKLIPLLIIIGISVLCKNVIGALILSWIFISMRYCTGGYHARTPARCVFMSVFIIGGSVVVCSFITQINEIIQVCLILLSICNILVKAPVDCSNRRLSEAERIKLKRTVKLVLMFYVSLYFAALIYRKYNLEILFGIFWVSAMLFENKNMRENSFAHTEKNTSIGE